ncbi:MAG: UDP-glucose 4-epimerase GalE [Bacteroidetes bacterium]|nr:UDP-glucose 4-epimerase GalE [Bacteroidota bacterium]
MRVCVTGGAGFVGSHVLLDLIAQQHDVLVLDNFSTTSPTSLVRARSLSNGNFEIATEDVCNLAGVTSLFQEFRPDCVIHCAGLKAVGESQDQPLRYYGENVSGAINLLKAMDVSGCKMIIFSSSATVYGEPHYLPYDEAHPVKPTNVYGRTKAIVENIIEDWVAVEPSRSAALLRYFNPVGAHSSGEIGEDPLGIPNNLMPYIADVAVGNRDKLAIFGDDYATPDGTGVRDYIHISDLSLGHLAALDFLDSNHGVHIFNLGSGKGYSVLEVVQAFETASGKPVPYEIAPRRSGDIAMSYADPGKANKSLGWETKLDLDDMRADIWRWRTKNPTGYRS